MNTNFSHGHLKNFSGMYRWHLGVTDAAIGIKRRASGFTLVELLVVLAIIAILTSAMAFAVAGAQEQARVNRTVSQVERIENILQRELLDMMEAPLPVRAPSMGNTPISLGPHAGTLGATGANANFMSRGEGAFQRARRFNAEARRIALLTRFPYRADLVLAAGGGSFNRPYDVGTGLPFVPYRQNNGAAGRRDFHGIPSNLTRAKTVIANTPGATFGLRPVDPIEREQQMRTDSSELLYLALGRIWVDGEPATSLLRQSEIGDSDNDGLAEVLDVWGDPIFFRLQMTLPVQDRATVRNRGVYNVPLDEMSAWMQGFQVNGFIFDCEDVSPESFDPERVRVVVASSNLESAFRFDNPIVPTFP